MDDKKKEEENRQGGVGRTNFLAQDPHNDQEGRGLKNTSDISEVDRQEGAMDHGSKGGNFDDPSIDATGRKEQGARDGGTPV